MWKVQVQVPVPVQVLGSQCWTGERCLMWLMLATLACCSVAILQLFVTLWMMLTLAFTASCSSVFMSLVPGTIWSLLSHCGGRADPAFSPWWSAHAHIQVWRVLFVLQWLAAVWPVFTLEHHTSHWSQNHLNTAGHSQYTVVLYWAEPCWAVLSRAGLG